MSRRLYMTIGAAAITGALTAALLVALSASGNSNTPVNHPNAASTLYSVYSADRPQAIFPAAIENAAQNLVVTDKSGAPAGVLTGEKVPGTERLLLDKPSALGLEVYGFATTSGRVCEIVPGIMAGCDKGSVQTDPVVWMSGGPVGGPAIITGIARDGVKSVSVVIDGKSQPASLANNTFYREIPLDELSKVTSLVVTMKDSSEVTIDIGPLA
jgi:hypothetical protein